MTRFWSAASRRWLLDPASVFFGSLAVLMIALGAVLVTSVVSVGRINASSKHTFVEQALPVTAQVRGLLLALVNEETAVRGYIVTGDPRNLTSYWSGRRQAARDLAALERFSVGQPQFRPLLERARREIAAVDRYFAQEIALVRLGYPGQIRAQLKIDQGRVLFDRFRATANAIDVETNAFIRRGERHQDATYRHSVIALALLGGIGLALSVGMALLGPLHVRRLYSERARGARASLALDHVGDAVALLAADGSLLYANRAALGMFRSPAAADAPFPPLELLRSQIEDAVGDTGAAVTIPVEAPDERWLSIVAVHSEGGTVYRLRDVTEEHELERLRSDFVATASHELRTPVAAVYGAAQTLRRTDVEFDEEIRGRLLEMISTEAGSLAEIVDQILLTNELDEGLLTVSRRPVDPVVVAEAVVGAAASKAPENVSVSLRVVDGGDGPPFVTDETRLRQILVNLVENAVKYSPDGGAVEVDVRRAPDLVSFEVRDEGMGIAPEDRERIFQKFYRADPSMSRGVGGTGLGLYIVNELVTRLGGRIAVDSVPGLGSAFRVDFPLGAP
ncbi:MAG TPA: ATP-binding protein [Gaiellaceae bacterium]|jgi:signal transduction histidine kinase